MTETPQGSNVKQESGKGTQPSEKKTWAQAERYIQLGVTLPAATVIGWLIGAGMDRLLGTGWIYLFGLILGIAAGFWQFIKVATSDPSMKD